MESLMQDSPRNRPGALQMPPRAGQPVTRLAQPGNFVSVPASPQVSLLAPSEPSMPTSPFALQPPIASNNHDRDVLNALNSCARHHFRYHGSVAFSTSPSSGPSTSIHCASHSGSSNCSTSSMCTTSMVSPHQQMQYLQHYAFNSAHSPQTNLQSQFVPMMSQAAMNYMTPFMTPTTPMQYFAPAMPEAMSGSIKPVEQPTEKDVCMEREKEKKEEKEKEKEGKIVKLRIIDQSAEFSNPSELQWHVLDPASEFPDLVR